MKHSAQLHKKLYSLYKEKGLTDDRRELVLNFTDGRTNNSSELSTNEIISFISLLAGEKPKKKSPELNVNKLFHLCHLYGWKRFDEEKNKNVVDTEHLNEWLIKYGKYHKQLNDHTQQEINKVTVQFEMVVNKLLKAI